MSANGYTHSAMVEASIVRDRGVVESLNMIAPSSRLLERDSVRCLEIGFLHRSTTVSTNVPHGGNVASENAAA